MIEQLPEAVKQTLAERRATPACLPISVIVLTYNEEQNIEACLESLAGWAGEIFVVDSGSTDSTVDIARRQGATVVNHPFENYSRQRNWAQENLPLAFDWVFHIDADERATPELVSSIRELFGHGDPAGWDGVLISRRTVFLGRAIMHGGHYPAWHLRLFRHRVGRCEDRLYDQHFVVNGATRRVTGDLIDVITSDLTVWLTRLARWGAAEAEEELDSRGAGAKGRMIGRINGTPIERRRWLRTAVYGRTPLFLRAFAYFVYRYFIRFGFLDGTEGLVFHFIQGCVFRFYIDAKIYEQGRRTHQNGTCAERPDRSGPGKTS